GFAQSEPDAQRLRRLGLHRVEAVGSTKWDAESPRRDPALLERLEPFRAGRRVLLLASSHNGEEQLLLQAWPRLRQALGPLLLLLVPRHPERARAVCALAARRQLKARPWDDLETDREAMADPGSCGALDAVVVDRLGSMGSWIAAADLVVMGGSLAPHGRCVGGHNPLEPVRAGKVVVCGPDMANFAGLTETLAAMGWLHQFPSTEALWSGVVRLLEGACPAPPPLQLEGPSAQIARRIIAELVSGAKLLPMASR
ncbi:3-deoxy-D-manno-octulosonic acid transferase, partial [Aphanothece microscopica]